MNDQPLSGFVRVGSVDVQTEAQIIEALHRENTRLRDENLGLKSAADAYWDAVSAYTTERGQGPLSTTLGWSIRSGAIGEALDAVDALRTIAKAGLEL